MDSISSVWDYCKAFSTQAVPGIQSRDSLHVRQVSPPKMSHNPFRSVIFEDRHSFMFEEGCETCCNVLPHLSLCHILAVSAINEGPIIQLEAIYIRTIKTMKGNQRATIWYRLSCTCLRVAKTVDQNIFLLFIAQ